jgi:uncharacterized protein YfaS (alpha-2-macroglobulin family)
MNISGIKSVLRKPSFYIIICAITATAFYFVNKTGHKNSRSHNPAFAKYISAYTSGTISKEAGIRIQLSGNFGDSTRAVNDLFSFSPDISGTTRWVDASTIEFKPDKPLPSGTEYEATFHLQKITQVPDDLEAFEFEFNIIQQSFEVKYPVFESMDRQTLVYQRVRGTLLTADAEEDTNVEKLLTAQENGTTYHIKWQHAADKRTHHYTIDSVERKNAPIEILVKWKGSSMDVDLQGEHRVLIPALGDFRVMNATVQNDGEQYVSVYFSDPVLASQDLTGLIAFMQSSVAGNAGAIELRYTIDGNEIKCYPGVRMKGTHIMTVNQGIKNVPGNSLPLTSRHELDFADLLPSVTMIGKGVIVPASNKLMMPFEAVGLNAVDITVVKIYENNITQFLQVNDLGGDREMARVGRPVVKRTMRLDTDKLVDLSKPNRFAIELDRLIKTEPGAVYNVKISFKKAYSLYRCDAAKQTEVQNDETMASVEEEENWDGGNNQESSYWDYAEDYYSDDYNWNERDNPCHNSYYNPQRWVSRNIMASDLGIIAKHGTDGAYIFAVTDLRTAQPISGVKLYLLDYQQQEIITVTTGNDGIAQATPAKKPFLLVAKHNEQRGYLKLDDGSSLSLSHFDVSGDIVQKGLKGFIYGERSVWRPGDSIYLTFILVDRNHSLPPAHPVSFELFDPNGVLHKRTVESKSLNGFYSFHTSTDMESPTGTWIAKIKVGSVTFQKSLRIETVIPNRLKINLAFTQPYLTKENKIRTILKSQWLHGAIADGLAAKVDVTLSPAPTQFKGYDEYSFDDPTRGFSAETQTVFEGNLNDKGESLIESDIQVENRSAGMLTANFTTKVFETGGNFSIDRFSVPFHPYNSYVGIRLPKGDKTRGMLLTDTNHSVSIVSVKPDGSLVKGIKKVQVRLYKINWRWWWDRSDDDLTSYAQNEEYMAIQESAVTLVNGKGSWNLRINYPEWGRYLIKVTDADGHSTGKTVYIDWPGWAGRAQRDNAVEASMLTFTADKTSYAVGDDVKLVIPSSPGGRALVSIESGSKVIHMYWVETKEKQTPYSFKVTADMMPNVYVHVTLIQPHAQTENDLPIRLYGMLPISITNPETILKPQITMAAQLKPDEFSTINVSETNGKAMTYTLAVVDEGLLDLTRFKTPDPHTHFYAREALGVKTWDMYDYVMGAFGIQMNRILSIGGDEGINKKSGNKKANRFKPVVKFLGPFYLKAGEKASHQLMIQDYVGSVRVMVVAGHKGAYGFTEKAVPVKKPLMVLASLPRVLGPGEQVKLPVTVFALENNIRNVTVEVQANSLLQIQGNAKKNIVFTKPGDEIVDFDLSVKSLLGIAKVKVIVTANGNKAVYDVQLDVRNPNPYLTSVYEGIADAGKDWRTQFVPQGMTGTNTAVLEVSSIPAMNLEKRLRYLVTYPHGCVEQTTSSVFPQLALNSLMELNPAWKNEIERNIKTGIQKLKNFQTPDGGLSYWPGESHSDEWGTNYAGHFMIEAQNAGYALPVNFMANWKKYQRNKALTWTTYESNSNDLIQAYRLYTLALAKAAELGAMNRLKELKSLSPAARWRLAAAYMLTGHRDVAAKLLYGQPLKANDYNDMSFTYGSGTRDEAMILETLVLLGERQKAVMVLENVCAHLASEEWMSTQTTAYSLLAVSKLVGKYTENSMLEFTYTINEKSSTYRSSSRIAQIPVTVNDRSEKQVLVTNKSRRILYTRVITRGQPETDDATTFQNNLNMSVVYMDMHGNELDPKTIRQGTDFKAEVTVSNPGLMGNYNQMALTQIFPSGWEIINIRITNDNDAGEQVTVSTYNLPRYQDIRDDRVYTYFDLAARQKATYTILLNASYLGRYYLPGVSCDAMYNGRIGARTAGMWVEVVPRVAAKPVVMK